MMGHDDAIKTKGLIIGDATIFFSLQILFLNCFVCTI